MDLGITIFRETHKLHKLCSFYLSFLLESWWNLDGSSPKSVALPAPRQLPGGHPQWPKPTRASKNVSVPVDAAGVPRNVWVPPGYPYKFYKWLPGNAWYAGPRNRITMPGPKVATDSLRCFTKFLHISTYHVLNGLPSELDWTRKYIVNYSKPLAVSSQRAQVWAG